MACPRRDMSPVQAIHSATTLTLDDERFAKLVSKERLRATWRIIRREARRHRIRDVVDYLDWSRSIDECLPDLSHSLLEGSYAPQPPARYDLAKAKGSFRVVTVPALRDAIVYRLLCDEALEIAMPQKVPGAYFSRRHTPTPVGTTFDVENDPYLQFFHVWMRYQQYRTKTLLNQPYEVLVTSDISNYFDSISHELLLEYLSPLGLPRKAVGLLGRLLEALKPATGHSPNPRIGIPVDEFECSRELAHVFLFEHDHRICQEVGEDNYVRWMDDQNIGVRTLAEARRVVNLLTRSLSLQRLTLNAGKTRFLRPEEVANHFHLAANASIDGYEERYLKGRQPSLAKQRAEFRKLWLKIANSTSAKAGHWEKILKRMYGLAARLGTSLLNDRMPSDLVEFPELDERIFLALARMNHPRQLLKIFKAHCKEWGSLFEATEATLFDTALLADMPSSTEELWREFALDFSCAKVEGASGGAYGQAAAMLALYWFGADGQHIADVFLNKNPHRLPAPVARAWLTTTVVLDRETLPQIQAALVGHPSDDVARLSQFLGALLRGDVAGVGDEGWGARPRWPASGKYYDARTWLQLDLLATGSSSKLKAAVAKKVKSFANLATTRQEKRVLARIRDKLSCS